jgi:hypothetical protein
MKFQFQKNFIRTKFIESIKTFMQNATDEIYRIDYNVSAKRYVGSENVGKWNMRQKKHL